MTTLIVVYCPRCDYFKKIAVQVVAGTHGCAQCNELMEVYVPQELARRDFAGESGEWFRGRTRSRRSSVAESTRNPPTSVCIFEMCLQGLHTSCIRYGPPPTTVGGTRVVCGCSCHTGQDPDWKPSDADRMATSFAFQFGTDPRVDQIVEGKFRAE